MHRSHTWTDDQAEVTTSVRASTPLFAIMYESSSNECFSPSLDYMEEFKKEWVGVDLYDIAERGMLSRSLSRFVSDDLVPRDGVVLTAAGMHRPFSILTRSMQYWMNLSEEARQELSSFEGSGSVVVHHRYVDQKSERALALSKVRIGYVRSRKRV